MEALAPAASTMFRLRDETSELLRLVENELDLFGSSTSWLDYRLYLFRMYGFHATAERALAARRELATVIGDAALRNHKVALISHDLVALGVDRRDLAQLPRITAPVLAGLPEAVGWMYVLEAATLHGKRLARHLAPQLPLEIETASGYLNCYGAEVAARWQAFGHAVDAYAIDAGTEDRIVLAARDCYLRLHRWLRPAAVVKPPALQA
ncbi:MAG: biliverdin-producing heme oxygenase [Deltaproteobacteria bacterium]|nr:biliverdin-producing heme oxygenase [Deltaproteobacteria bacterium]MDQ3297709.1 biliverdin-producing heme oxygenase [Myxococcota bacterium]